MENTKNFFFYSFSFAMGLLIYTFFLYLAYLIFMKEGEETETVNATENGKIKEGEKLTDLEELDFIEDVEENV